MQVQGRILQPTHGQTGMTNLNLSIACDEAGYTDRATTHRLEAVRIMKAACPGRCAMAAKAALILSLFVQEVQDAGLRARVQAELLDARATLTLFYGAHIAHQTVR